MGGSDDGSGSVVAAEINTKGQEEDEDEEGSGGAAAVPPGDACPSTDEVIAPEPETATHDSPVPSLNDEHLGQSSRQHENKAVATATPSPATTSRATARRDDGSETIDNSAGMSPAAITGSEQSSESAVLSPKDVGAASANRRSGAEGTAVGGNGSGRGKRGEHRSVNGRTQEDGVGVDVGVAAVGGVGGVGSGGDRKRGQTATSKKTRSEEHRLENKDAGQEKQDGIVELLETAASHTVDCLLFIRW